MPRTRDAMDHGLDRERQDVPDFDRLVAQGRDRVFRLALRFFRRREDAEEVTQEVFLRVWRSLPGYRGEAPLEHWLLRIATRTCQDHLRARRRSPEAVPDERLHRALRGASLAAARDEAARGLASDLLDRLSPKDRIVLVLMDIEGRSAREVASLTGSTRAAVKVRAMRARRALKRLAETTPTRS